MRRRTMFNPLSKTGVYVMHSDGIIEKVTISGNPDTKKTNAAISYPTGGCTATNVSTTDIGIIVVDTDLDTVFMLTAPLVKGIPWYNTNSGNQTGSTQLNTRLSVTDYSSQANIYDTITDYQRVVARNHHKSGATGVTNTAAIKNAAIANNVSQANCAAYYCYNQTILLPNGEVARGYLPSVAEMMVISDNIYTINAGLIALGGSIFSVDVSGYSGSGYTYSYFWTSTEYSSS